MNNNVNTLLVAVFLLLVGIAGLGFYQGWFRISMDNTDRQPSATITVDEDKFHEDEQTAKDKVQAFGQAAKEKLGGAGKVKEPEGRP